VIHPRPRTTHRAALVAVSLSLLAAAFPAAPAAAQHDMQPAGEFVLNGEIELLDNLGAHTRPIKGYASPMRSAGTTRSNPLSPPRAGTRDAPHADGGSRGRSGRTRTAPWIRART
jgi:hypothetical protein